LIATRKGRAVTAQEEHLRLWCRQAAPFVHGGSCDDPEVARDRRIDGDGDYEYERSQRISAPPSRNLCVNEDMP
jgi:hypothetical protein